VTFETDSDDAADEPQLPDNDEWTSTGATDFIEHGDQPWTEGGFTEQIGKSTDSDD
jgi:hypothetical protein